MAGMARWRRAARTKQLWLGALAATVAVLLASVALGAGDDDVVAEDAPAGTTSTASTTTTVRSATTTTAAHELPALPDRDAPGEGLETDPARTGGLSALGVGTFDVDALLAGVEVRPESTGGDYDRSRFGGWIDADGNSCDTRAEVLRAESATPAQVDPGRCTVVAGDWLSIYDGYTTDDPTELEIDHLVALAEAWRSGADAWSDQRRIAFANDLDHPGALVAVTAATNRSKSDRDPASWQPSNRGAWCLYAADWLTVKQRWQLTMDAREARALRNMLAGCGQGSPPATAAPTPPPAPSPAPVAGSGCDAAYPDVCVPPAPPDLDCGEIPHRRFRVLPPDPHRFDGDGDGLGCES